MQNPFLDMGEFPDFPKMTPTAADEALPQLLADAKARVDEVEKTATPDWEGFVRALDDAQHALFAAWGIVSHMQSVCNSEAWRAIEEKYQGEIVSFGLRVGQSHRFYELAQTLHTKMRAAGGSPVRLRILEKMIQGAQLAGVALEGERQKRFNEIQAELAKLSNDFHNHVLDATKAFSLVLANPVEVDGLPSQLKAMMAGAHDPEKGPWKATIEDAVYVPFMKHSRNRPVREALFRARATRAVEGGLNNTPLIDRILKLRTELAHLLGFANYAELSLASKCAPSVAAVYSMMDELAAASRPVAAKEDAALSAFAAANGFAAGALRPWDIAFWSERQREKMYSYSEEELSKYFNLPDVLEGLFQLANRLFGITVERADGVAAVWHPDVKFFRVRNAEGEEIAHFYFDPYSRPETKSGGAWMNELRSRDRRPDGTLRKPLALVCCNQARPDAHGRALMRFTEVETLFHEFGHALQQMLTTVDDVDAAGLNLIDWDAVEVASQFMENWCFDATTVKSFARHVQTHEPIPDALLARVRAAKNYRAANASLRQLSFAKLDMALHVSPPADPNAFKEQVFAAYTPHSYIPEDRFLNAFTHIFAGGYAAGYYGYKWSEVMSADAFAAFEEAGLENDEAVRRVGRHYRDTILALGGGVNPLDVFRRFRGRDPSVEALLRQTGLKE